MAGERFSVLVPASIVVEFHFFNASFAVEVDGTVLRNFVDPRCELRPAATAKAVDSAGNGEQNIGGEFFGVCLRHIHSKAQKPNQGGSQGINQLLDRRLGVGLKFPEKLWRIEILKGRSQPL